MSEKVPVVPQELAHSLTGHVLAVHERHESRSFDELKSFTAEMEASNLSAGDEGMSRAIVIANKGADLEAGVSIYPFAYQQAWKPSWAARVHFYHDVVNPHGFTIALPNNSGKKQYYEFTAEELEVLNGGNLQPLYEKHVRTIKKLLGTTALGEVRVAGYSQGALSALGIAALGDLPVTKVHAFEAPSEERSPKQLKKDFTKSGGPFDQRAAIKDAAIPALTAALRVDRMASDYARFGLDSFDNANVAQMNAMATPNVNGLIESIIGNSDADVMLGYVEGSHMKGEFKPVEHDRLRVVQIATGTGSHRHATGDNIVANALMMNL